MNLPFHRSTKTQHTGSTWSHDCSVEPLRPAPPEVGPCIIFRIAAVLPSGKRRSIAKLSLS